MSPQLLIAAIIAALGFGTGWQIQSWRYTAKEADRAKEELVQIQASAASNIRRADNVIIAQNRANARAVVLRSDADSARSESGRLRDELSAATRAGVTPAACPAENAKLRDILGECSQKYEEVARDADSWENDAIMMQDAWPK